jgi:integrase
VKNRHIEVKAKGLTVKIFVTRSTKGDKIYTTYQVADYPQVDPVTGKRKRKLWSFADEGAARAKALELCEGNLKAQEFNDADMAQLFMQKRRIHNAMEEAERIGMEVDDAVRLVRMASEIVPLREILDACKAWRDNRPDQPFTPKTIKQATADYLSRQGRLSGRRRKALTSYFGQLENKFGGRLLHELTTIELKDWMDGRDLKASSFNCVLGAYSLIYRDAQSRGHVPPDCNPVAAIKRLKVTPGHIGIMEPGEVRTIMATVKDDLKPFLSLWFFGGLRKDEISRLHWRQIRMAVKTGVLEIEAEQGIKTGARCVPLQPNLKAWLQWSLRLNPDVSGPVLPLKYSKGRLLDNLQRTISRQSGVKWVPNAGRHSYISYRAKLVESTATISDECGNSPAEIERRYRKKGTTVEAAYEFFAIRPPAEENVIPMPQKMTVAV